MTKLSKRDEAFVEAVVWAMTEGYKAGKKKRKAKKEKYAKQ
jgi:hypothetical protein